MTAKEPRVKLTQLLLLLGIVIGSITALGILAIIVVAEWPLVTAITWHVHNGNTVTLEGHTFNVPLLYEPEVTKGGRQIDIVEYPRMMGGLGSVTLESNAKVLDESWVNHWQLSLLDVLSKHPSTLEHDSPITLRGKKLTFVCINSIYFGTQETLICHAVGTGITATTMASPEHIAKTRAILETSN